MGSFVFSFAAENSLGQLTEPEDNCRKVDTALAVRSIRVGIDLRGRFEERLRGSFRCGHGRRPVRDRDPETEFSDRNRLPTPDEMLLVARSPNAETGGRVTRLPGRTTLEAARIDILSPSKERAKECNLLFGRRSVMDGPWMRCHCPFSIQNTQMADNSLSLARQSGVRRSSARCGQPRHAR